MTKIRVAYDAGANETSNGCATSATVSSPDVQRRSRLQRASGAGTFLQHRFDTLVDHLQPLLQYLLLNR
jgi:hypothetical protein